MATDYGNKSIVTDGLVFLADAANKQSYPRSGTTATDTINNTSGTLYNSVGFSNDNSGVFTFDGASDYIDFGNPSLTAVTNVSISIWCNFSEVSSNHNIYAKPEQYWFHKPANSQIQFKIYTSGRITLNSGTTPSTNTWYNLVGTYDGSIMKVYVNGVLGGTKSESNSLATNSNSLILGGWTGAADDFNGKASCMKLYNRALLASEVLQNYNALKSRFE